MTTPLPSQGQLVVPIMWSGLATKNTIRAADYTLSGTMGLRPWRETATLTWKLLPSDALALLNNLKAGLFNAVYSYACNLRGDVRLRPTDTYSFQERRGTQFVDFTMTFETV